MKQIQLTFTMSDELFLKSVTIDQNDTGLKNDSELILKVCSAIIRSFMNNKDSLAVQDMFNELNIKTSK